MGVGEKHQIQALDVPALPQLLHGDAAVNQDFTVNYNRISAGTGGEDVIGHIILLWFSERPYWDYRIAQGLLYRTLDIGQGRVCLRSNMLSNAHHSDCISLKHFRFAYFWRPLRSGKVCAPLCLD